MRRSGRYRVTRDRVTRDRVARDAVTVSGAAGEASRDVTPTV